MRPASDQRRTVFSTCRRWRYTLWRSWDERLPYCQFIGLNPSTADEVQDDPTVRRCIRFARDWGYGALCMTNAFAYRATDPGVMKVQPDPVGRANDRWLGEIAAAAGIVVAAWGVHGAHLDRDRQLAARLGKLHCLGTTRDGHPRHPLYVRADTRPRPWRI